MTGWDGFAKYVGVQGVLALMITSIIGYLVCVGTEVPPELWALGGTAVGFYLAKNGYAITPKGIKHYNTNDAS